MPFNAQAEIYVVDGLAIATYATSKGFKHQGKMSFGGKWVYEDDLICRKTNGFVLSVKSGMDSKRTCWFDIFYGKNLKPGWKLIDSKFKKLSSNSRVSYRIKKRSKNTNILRHGITVTSSRSMFGYAKIQLVSVTLQGPNNARWADAF